MIEVIYALVAAGMFLELWVSEQKEAASAAIKAVFWPFNLGVLIVRMANKV